MRAKYNTFLGSGRWIAIVHMWILCRSLHFQYLRSLFTDDVLGHSLLFVAGMLGGVQDPSSIAVMPAFGWAIL